MWEKAQEDETTQQKEVNIQNIPSPVALSKDTSLYQEYSEELNIFETVSHISQL